MTKERLLALYRLPLVQRLMPVFWMVVSSWSFAGTSVCIKAATQQGMSVAETMFYRSFMALLIITIYIRYRGFSLRPPTLATVKAHAARSGIGAVAMVFNVLAVASIPLATAVTLIYTSPLFLTLILFLVYKEKMTAATLVLLVSGFAGVAMLLQPSFSGHSTLGLLFGLMTGFLFAFVNLGVRALGRLGEPEWRTVFYFFLTSTLLALGWALWEGFRPLNGLLLLLILGMGFYGSLAQVMMTAAYKQGKTLAVANAQYTTVIFASIGGAVLWQEHLSPLAWGGIVLIVSSNVLMSALPLLKTSLSWLPKRLLLLALRRA